MMEGGPLLDSEAGVEHALLVEGLADDLQPKREPLRIEPGRDGHGRKAGGTSGP